MTVGESLTGLVSSVAAPLGEAIEDTGRTVTDIFSCFRADRRALMGDRELLGKIPKHFKIVPKGFEIVEEEESPYFGLARNPSSGEIRFPTVRIPDSVELSGVLEEVRESEKIERQKAIGLGFIALIFVGVTAYYLWGKKK